MNKKPERTYDVVSEGARLREQHRFTFSIAIVATVFVVPNNNALELFLKIVLSVSAFFASLYLITSAAQIKYKDAGYIYEVFPVYESFRMWTFDWSINIFGFSFLLFISLLLTGLIDKTPGVELGALGAWITTIITLLVVSSLVFIVSWRVELHRSKEKERLPEI